MKPNRLIISFLAAVIVLAALPAGLIPQAGQAFAAGPPRSGGMEQFTLNDPPRPVPDTPFVDGAGKELTLADFRGRVILVNFWATWCAPCIRELPSLDRLQADMGSKEFEVVAITVDRKGSEIAGPFLRKLGVESLAVNVDNHMSLARALGLRGMPSTYLIDRDSKIVGSLTGLAEWDSDETKALIRYYLDRD